VKYVDDKVTLNVRLQGAGGDALSVARAYATVKFPWDITANFGRFPLDWEADFYATDFAGYNMNDAFVTDFDPLSTAYWMTKPFSMGNFEAFVAHEEDLLSVYPGADAYIYGARLAFDVNENLKLAANWVKYDYTVDVDHSTLWGDIIVNFNENVAFKGQYFMQDLDSPLGPDDSPNAWKAILTFSQDMLKFTDLWIEYAQIDQGFGFFNADPYGWALESIFGFYGYAPDDANVLNIVAHQKWNDQWWTYVRYFDYDGNEGYKNYTASVRYNYTPNLWFELGYDKQDFEFGSEDPSMVWFRTTVNF